MPLAGSESVLAAAIVTALKPTHPELTGAAETKAIADWTPIAKAILEHIVANGVVVVSSGAGAPGGGTIT